MREDARVYVCKSALLGCTCGVSVSAGLYGGRMMEGWCVILVFGLLGVDTWRAIEFRSMI